MQSNANCGSKVSRTFLTMLCGMMVTGNAFSAPTPPAAQPQAPAAASQPQNPAGPNMLAGWQDKWPDGSSSGAALKNAGGLATVAGTSSKQSYGNVHKRIMWDLEKTPVLVVDVTAVTGFWFVVAKNKQIKQGYVRVQPDSNTTGRYFYDLKAITGLSGKQEIEVELGISSGKADPNNGKSFSLKDIALQEKMPVPGALRVSGWKDKWPDGTATSAIARENTDGTFTITGASKTQGFGTAYRVVVVNLDKTPTFKTAAIASDSLWYVEALGGSVQGGPIKIQPDTTLLEPQFNNLVDTLGIQGEVNFELHVGVTTGSEEANNGKTATFNGDMGFYPPETAPKQ